jgi:TRAP-type mannitol/chloroaromatic compound transport system permease small subunit
MRAAMRVVHVIDAFTDQIGKVVAFLVVLLTLALCFEALSRYLFGAPTVWAYDMTYILDGALFMLGASYALLWGAHIRTDIIYRNLSPRRQGLLDAVLYLVFFFPGMLLFLVAGYEYAHRSWLGGEQAAVSPWRPIIWPFKALIPITAILLMIQGVSELLKSIYAAVEGRWPAEHHEEDVLG